MKEISASNRSLTGSNFYSFIHAGKFAKQFYTTETKSNILIGDDG